MTMSALGRIADVRQDGVGSLRLNVCFHRKRTFKLLRIELVEGQLSARSGRSRGTILGSGLVGARLPNLATSSAYRDAGEYGDYAKAGINKAHWTVEAHVRNATQ